MEYIYIAPLWHSALQGTDPVTLHIKPWHVERWEKLAMKLYAAFTGQKQLRESGQVVQPQHLCRANI